LIHGVLIASVASLHHDLSDLLPVVGASAAHYFLLGGGDGHDNHVVLILSAGVLPLGNQSPNHSEGYLAYTDGLPDGIFAGEKVIDNGLAEQRYFVGGADIFGGERFALLDPDIANGQVF